MSSSIRQRNRHKKLIDVGYLWAGGQHLTQNKFAASGVNKSSKPKVTLTPYEVQTLKRWGVKRPEGLVDENGTQPTGHIIESHLWQTWHNFQMVCDQWVFQPAGLGGGIRIGLNTASVMSYLTVAMSHKKALKQFELIKYIASGVLKADFENRRKK